eukprot:6200525-Pleurochrysis_carterae.AAC.3
MTCAKACSHSTRSRRSISFLRNLCFSLVQIFPQTARFFPENGAVPGGGGLSGDGVFGSGPGEKKSEAKVRCPQSPALLPSVMQEKWFQCREWLLHAR